MAKTNAVVVNPLRVAGAQARASLTVLHRSLETQALSQPVPKPSAASAKAAKKK